MKTRTDAARVLLDNGWSFEDVERVLGRNETTFVPMPYPVEPFPLRRVWEWDPTRPVLVDPIHPTIITTTTPSITETTCGTTISN